MKIFISQPMNGKSHEEIFSERSKNEELVKEMLKGSDEEVTFIDSINYDYVPSNKRSGAIWQLGESIKKLSLADAVYFAKGFEDARGCCAEYNIAMLYGVPSFDSTSSDLEMQRVLSKVKQNKEA